MYYLNIAIGLDDTFEFDWINCLLDSDDRYFQGVMQIANYQLNNDITPRSMSFSSVFSRTLIVEDAIDAISSSLTRSRIVGTLLVSATEGATVSSGN